MNMIVKEVDAISQDPSIATDEDHKEPFISIAEVWDSIPVLDLVKPRSKETPLTGVALTPKTGQALPAPSELPDVFLAESGELSVAEKDVVSKLQQDRVKISEHLGLTAPVGSGNDQTGSPFCNLDFMQPGFVISSVAIEMREGALGGLTVTYTNGLVLIRGSIMSQYNGNILDELGSVERIIAGSIETGVARGGNNEAQVTGLGLYTNRGRSLIATAESSVEISDKAATRDGRRYDNLTTTSWDMPLANGYVNGFWGRSDEIVRKGTIWRLGFVWGDLGQVSNADSAELYQNTNSTKSGGQATSQFGDERKNLTQWGKFSLVEDLPSFDTTKDNTIAYDSAADGKTIRNGSIGCVKNESSDADQGFSKGRFARPPGAFIALGEFHVGSRVNQQAMATVVQVSPERLKTNRNRLGNTEFARLSATWVGIQG